MRVKSNFHFMTINNTLHMENSVGDIELIETGSWETYCSGSSGIWLGLGRGNAD